jgi:pimeloyl-ACP methyl ester carboxylesterase
LSSVIPGAARSLVYAINYPKEVAGIVLVAPAVYESQDLGSLVTNLPAVRVLGDTTARLARRCGCFLMAQSRSL